MRGGIGTAVKSVKLLSSIYSFAIRKELADLNPCNNIEKPGDNRRTRFLRPEEYQRLGAVLKEARLLGLSQAAIDAIYALALTGCRKGEILALRKRSIDAVGSCLRLTETKTGPQLRPCGKVALGYLSSLAKRLPGDDDLLFPPSKGAGGLLDISKPLAKVCEAAEILEVSAHTFRHSYATVAHELGYTELTIAGLLGHSAGSVTSRYAHHVDHALASAASRVAELIISRLRAATTVVSPEPGNAPYMGDHDSREAETRH